MESECALSAVGAAHVQWSYVVCTTRLLVSSDLDCFAVRLVFKR